MTEDQIRAIIEAYEERIAIMIESQEVSVSKAQEIALNCVVKEFCHD
jgi:hypothetical protein